MTTATTEKTASVEIRPGDKRIKVRLAYDVSDDTGPAELAVTHIIYDDVVADVQYGIAHRQDDGSTLMSYDRTEAVVQGIEDAKSRVSSSLDAILSLDKSQIYHTITI